VVLRWFRRRGGVFARPVRPAPQPTGRTSVQAARRAYPGDFAGIPQISYSPHPDGLPDPGEVVWAWVPFEEDHSRGKDRPALIIGRDGAFLLGLMLTSKDHDRDAEQEARHHRSWLDVGIGGWDAQRRPSEVRLDRILRLSPGEVRREGAALSRAMFDQVAAGVRSARR
jgi:hypothetical protein